MKQLIISCSLSPSSRSAIMANRLVKQISELNDEVRLIDLRQLDLPFCDGKACYAHPNVLKLQQAMKSASVITIATPIYNYETGGATRNVSPWATRSGTAKSSGSSVQPVGTIRTCR